MSAPFVEREESHRLFVRDWGEGPPLLFLSPWAMDSRLWADVMAEVAGSGRRAAAYDRRGHGRSTDPGTCDADLLVGDLAAVVEALDLRDLTLVAHSSSAGEAIRYAAGPGAARLSRLVLVAPTGPTTIAGPDGPGWPREGVEATLADLARDLPAWIDANAEPFAPGLPARTVDWLAAMIMDTSRRIALQFRRQSVEEDLTALAAGLALPVAILHGDRDASAPLEMTGRRYAALIPGARLTVYEGGPHALMMTHARRLAADLLALTARAPGTPAARGR